MSDEGSKSVSSRSDSDHSLMPRIKTFIRIMNVRLRFIFLMVLVGLVAGNWERLTNYYERWRRPTQLPEMVASQDVEFYCPMHPNIVRSQPGSCPICGMPLSKRAKTGHRELAEGILAQVQMSPQKVQMGRIATTPIAYQLLTREIRTVGIVEYDETRRTFVAARVKGRLDKLFVNFVGQHIKKGEPLAAIYSPDLLVAQEELLTALRQTRDQDTRSDFAGGVGKSLVEASRKKLTLWGFSDEQINDIVKRGSAQTHLEILSPIDGIVTEKNVLEGRYVSEGDNIYTIADLSRVWTQIKVFEDEISGIDVGTAVEVTSVAFPNEIFAGRIAFIAYTVDPATRTVSARVEVSNPDLKLKPGMYVSAAIRLPVGEISPISSPSSAPAVAAGPTTDELAKAYVALVGAYADDKADADKLGHLAHQARTFSTKGDEDERKAASEIATLVNEMSKRDLKGQRDELKALSGRVIAFLRKFPPTKGTLFLAHCPMVNADWLQSSEEIANPYYGSQMLRCGQVTGKITAEAMPSAARFVQGYYCPIYPDRLFDKPAECPIDKFPMKFVRIERTLAVPESAVINTGSRTVVYRESAPGTYDMIEVKLGPRAGEFYPVIDGLKAGDRVATSGAFVVDAENRLNPAASAQYFGAGGSSGGGQHQHGN